MIHPVAVLFARYHVREGLRQGGARLVQAIEASRSVTAEDLMETSVSAGIAVPATLLVPSDTSVGNIEALGDGTLIKEIIAFFESPMGQILIKVLVSVLLAAMGL